jgi:hypothetical protein
MAAHRTTNVDVDPAKTFLPIRLTKKSARFVDGRVLVLAKDQDIRPVRGLPARLAQPRNKVRTWAKLPTQFPSAHEAIPAVEVLVKKQMLCPAVCTFGDNPKEEAAVDLGGARNDSATVFMGRPWILHLKPIGPARAFDVSNVLMLIGLCRLR